MYKETAEYAYDLLEHFYNIHILYIEEQGKNKIEMLVPTEIYKLLGKWNKEKTEVVYPNRFRGIDLVQYEGSTIDFVIKSK